jgi:hypothetical protein
MPSNVSIEILNFVTKGCLSNREHIEEAPKICAAVDLTLSSGGGLPRSARIGGPRSCPRIDIVHASKATRYTSGRRGSSLRHLMDAADV